jgi:hypothetical protein
VFRLYTVARKMANQIHRRVTADLEPTGIMNKTCDSQVLKMVLSRDAIFMT